MKEKARILITDGNGTGRLVAAMIDVFGTEYIEVAIPESRLDNTGDVFKDNMNRLDKLNKENSRQSFIQQKMQGKRRVY